MIWQLSFSCFARAILRCAFWVMSPFCSCATDSRFSRYGESKYVAAGAGCCWLVASIVVGSWLGGGRLMSCDAFWLIVVMRAFLAARYIAYFSLLLVCLFCLFV